MVKRVSKEMVHTAASILGQLGGHKGGVARAKKLTPERRKAIARKGARARWGD